MWLIAILCGMLVGKVLIHGLIFKRMLRLKMFRDEQVSPGDAGKVRLGDEDKVSKGDKRAKVDGKGLYIRLLVYDFCSVSFVW